MGNFLKLSSLMLIGLLATPNAYSMDLVEFLTFNTAAPVIQNSLDPSTYGQPGLSFGGGISLGFKLIEHLELEASVLYLTRDFSKSNSAGQETSYSLSMMQYPVVAKYWFSETFALGAGVYYSTGIGNLTQTQNTHSQIRGYNDVLISSTDTGLTFSGEYRRPMTENILLVGQARLLLSLFNLDQTGSGSHYTRDLQLWVGFGFIL